MVPMAQRPSRIALLRPKRSPEKPRRSAHEQADDPGGEHRHEVRLCDVPRFHQFGGDVAHRRKVVAVADQGKDRDGDENDRRRAQLLVIQKAIQLHRCELGHAHSFAGAAVCGAIHSGLLAGLHFEWQHIFSAD